MSLGASSLRAPFSEGVPKTLRLCPHEYSYSGDFIYKKLGAQTLGLWFLKLHAKRLKILQVLFKYSQVSTVFTSFYSWFTGLTHQYGKWLCFYSMCCLDLWSINWTSTFGHQNNLFQTWLFQQGITSFIHWKDSRTEGLSLAVLVGTLGLWSFGALSQVIGLLDNDFWATQHGGFYQRCISKRLVIVEMVKEMVRLSKEVGNFFHNRVREVPEEVSWLNIVIGFKGTAWALPLLEAWWALRWKPQEGKPCWEHR